MPTRRSRRLGARLAISLALLLLAGGATAEAAEPEEPSTEEAADEEAPSDEERARQLHDEAMAAKDAGEHERAAKLFDRAFELYPNGVLLWNAARTHQMAGHLEKAEKRYEKALARDDLPKDLRPKAADYLTEVRLAMKEQAAGEEGEPAGAPSGDADADDATDGRQTAPADEDVAAAEGTTGSTEPAGVTREHEPRARPPSPWGWATMSTGLAAVGAGLALHFHAEGLRDEVRSELPDDEGAPVDAIDQATAIDKRDDANARDTAGTVLMAAGGAATAAGIVVLLTTGGESSEGSSSPPTARLGALPTRGGGVLTATGRF